MFAVVQIGSSERRSPCITARMVRARAGSARPMPGMPEVAAAAASVPCTKRRRVVRMKVLPLFSLRRFTHETAPSDKPDSHNHASFRQLGMRPDGAARLGERIFARVERRGAFAVAVD